MRAKYSIREYGVISDGLLSNPYNSDSIEVDSETFSSLSNFIEENFENKDFDAAFLIFKKRGRRHIRVKNYVGVIETKQGVVLEILPKIYKDNNETSEEQAKQILINFLKTLKNSPFISLNTAHLDEIKKFPILEIFITVYINELSNLVNHELRGDYQLVEENNNFVKGKILITTNIKKNFFRKERFYCSFHEFSNNIPPNKIIKSTLKHLFTVTTSSQNKNKIIKLLDYFQHIDFSSSLDSDLNYSRVNLRFLNRYKNLLLWSEVYLKNKSFTSFYGKSVNQAILFPMEKLFESYISFLIKKYCNGLSIATQDKKYSLVGQKRDLNDSSYSRHLFKLKPDIVINQDLLIIDTKWKLLNVEANKYDLQESDLYQMNAYGRRYQSGNLINRPPRLGLIYPRNPNFNQDLMQMRYGVDLYLNVASFNLLEDPEIEIKRVIKTMS